MRAQDTFHAILLGGVLSALRTLPLADLHEYAAIVSERDESDFVLSAIETVIAEKQAALRLS